MNLRSLSCLLLLLVAGCAKPAAPPPPAPVKHVASSHVDVYPISLEKPDVLDKAAAWATEHGKVSFRVAEPVKVVWANIESGGRANSAALTQLMVSQAQRTKPEDHVLAVIGVCEREIGDKDGHSVGSVTAKEQHAGVLSWYLLRNETLGQPSDDAKLSERVGKQLLHTLGRTLDFTPCKEAQCVLCEPSSLAGLDAQNGGFCPQCLRAWQAQVVR